MIAVPAPISAVNRRLMIIASAGLVTIISSNASNFTPLAISSATAITGSPSSLARAARSRSWTSIMKAWKWVRRLGAMSIIS